MPRSAVQTRAKILQAAFKLFRRRGFFRAGLDEIANASGVTKRTLYQHFGSKDALLAAVLSAQHEAAFAQPHPYGINLEGPPERVVALLFDGLTNWAATPHWSGSGLTRLVIELADLPGHPARIVAQRHKASLEGYLADVLARSGVDLPSNRAKELILLIEGAMVMTLIHGDRSYAEAAACAATRLLGAIRDAS